MWDKEVQNMIDYLSKKYECVICPTAKTETLTTVCVLYKDQSMEAFDIVANNKNRFMIEMMDHFKNRRGA